jgi:hypothetical protein
MTAWTAKQIADLNKMNKAAQSVQLGTTLADLGTTDVSDIAAKLPATAGTVDASKLVQVGANKNVDVLAIADLKLGAGAGTSVTSTAAELNLLHNVSAGLTTAEINVLDGITKTTGEINALVGGVAGGYKIAYGVKAVGAASETIVTGLATVVAIIVTLVGDPSSTHMFSTATPGNQSGAPAAGSFILKSWTYTAADNGAPIAANTTFANVSWLAIGT